MVKKITPSEFVHLWNLILSKTLQLVKSQDCLPKVILEFDVSAVVPEHISIVVEHVIKDHQFNNIVEEQLGTPVSYTVNTVNNKILITTIKK